MNDIAHVIPCTHAHAPAVAMSQRKVMECASTLSNMSQMAERGWWMDAMMVWPRSARLLMCSITFRAAKLSSPGHPERSFRRYLAMIEVGTASEQPSTLRVKRIRARLRHLALIYKTILPFESKIGCMRC